MAERATNERRSLGVANGLVIAAGLYGNATDVIHTCNAKGWFEETCNRSVTRNTVSAGINVGGGIAVGIALSLVPVTGGLSIAIIAGGSFLWGLYGSEISDTVGQVIEEKVFD
ncbi:hypothetical protein RND59_16815 [Vibrio ruber]|uniref:hypothetical protein n=1 Tax=Vibrio ruber TaxID=184755 RepID=UPI002892C224|nr:hypothetical protein [Vibrio ruber]WNJ97789.1 hypothetical protein RND59_16815 [Vibrio ruber]